MIELLKAYLLIGALYAAVGALALYLLLASQWTALVALLAVIALLIDTLQGER